jgi:RsiW-degrading membrane proteinase PrsW (M82 family)
MRRRSRLLFALLIFVCGVAGSLSLLAMGIETGWTGFIAGLVMATVPVPFYLALATWIDRFEPEPAWLLATAFLWGATLAILFAMIFNGVAEGILGAFAGAEAASSLMPVLSAPFIEELAKGAALLLLFLWKRDEFDNVTDGIVYATMIGLGFAMTENVQYYGAVVNAGDQGQTLAVFFLRGILGPFSHPLFTSMTGIGFGIACESDKRVPKVLAPVAGLAGAIFLHGVWNLATTFGAMFFAAYFLIMVPAFFLVIAVIVFSLRREATLIRMHLQRVVADHVLSHDDVLVVTSVRARIAATAAAFLSGGPAKWAARCRFHDLATELAFHSWRSGRLTIEDADAIRVQLLDQVRISRARLGLPQEVTAPDPALIRRLTREIPLPRTPMPPLAAE